MVYSVVCSVGVVCNVVCVLFVISGIIVSLMHINVDVAFSYSTFLYPIIVSKLTLHYTKLHYTTTFHYALHHHYTTITPPLHHYTTQALYPYSPTSARPPRLSKLSESCP